MQMIITRKDAEAKLKKIFNIEHFLFGDMILDHRSVGLLTWYRFFRRICRSLLLLLPQLKGFSMTLNSR